MKKNTGASTPARALFVEHCWILTGSQNGETGWRFRRHCKSSGQVASVEAAWAWALRREERFQDVIGFFHTHPNGAGAQPSPRDIRTMRAWCSAFGKPLLCVIAAGKELNGYVFLNMDGQPEPVESVLRAEQGWYIVEGKRLAEIE